MKMTLLAAMASLAITGAASAQRATPMQDTPLFAHNQPNVARLANAGIPPLPPGCRNDLPQPPLRPAMPDFGDNPEWRSALGISTAQATQVQQLMQQKAAALEKERTRQRASERALCSQLRGIVGEKAMDRWAETSPPPPPPPMPPAPPRPPQPPVSAQ